jgi:hypothetical protein
MSFVCFFVQKGCDNIATVSWRGSIQIILPTKMDDVGSAGERKCRAAAPAPVIGAINCCLWPTVLDPGLIACVEYRLHSQNRIQMLIYEFDCPI